MIPWLGHFPLAVRVWPAGVALDPLMLYHSTSMNLASHVPDRCVHWSRTYRLLTTTCTSLWRAAY
eukprot:SAG11_NODE_1883_length_4124_cov_7.056149_1_plen_65_part_00